MSSPALPTTMSRPAARTGPLQISAAAVLWGTTGVVVQVLHRRTGLDAAGIGFYRLAVAAAVLVIVAAPHLRAAAAAVRRAPVALLLIGAGLGAYQALYFLAVALSGVAVATVVSLGVAPVQIAGWEALRERRLPGRGTTFSVLAPVAGLVLISGVAAAPAAAPRPLAGLLAATGSGAGYAVTTVLSRHLSGRVTPLILTTTSTVTGALILVPVAVLGGGLGFPVRASSAGLLDYLGVVTTAVAYALFYAGLRSTSGSAAVLLTLLEPLTAALLAVLILHEPLGFGVVAGGVLLLAAVLTASRTG